MHMAEFTVFNRLRGGICLNSREALSGGLREVTAGPPTGAGVNDEVADRVECVHEADELVEHFENGD